tara:strand:- start:312 stop:590 length:279 start_codon:yes stop_codon:yes gene_type:complete
MKDLFFKDDVLKARDTLIYKARNILSTQIGYLSYAPEFGIDYDLFFNQDYNIQTETFKAYAIAKLAENGMNPLEVLTQDNNLDTILNIQLAQ